MNRNDMTAAEALARLSVPGQPTDRFELDRRRFLQMVGYGVGAGALTGSLGELLGSPDARAAYAAPPISDTDGILIIIGQYGGRDGLNTVVPYADPNYQSQHGNLAFQAGDVLRINSSIGLHPSLTNTKALYDSGQVAILQGVGYPDPNLSHFSSMAYWMSAYPGVDAPTSGWIGRWLDRLGSDAASRALSLGENLPLHLVGSNVRAMAVPEGGPGFSGETDPEQILMYDAIRAWAATPSGRGKWHDVVAGSMRDMVDIGQRLAPVFAGDLPGGGLERSLTVAARLINADLGFRVIDTNQGGWDTHANEPWQVADLLGEFDRGVQSFFATLAPRFRDRVILMTFSEFGRTSYDNDSYGTDHGTSNCHFVIGSKVKGGLYGTQPSMAGLDRWDRMDFGIDFRSMYGTVLDGWMGGGAAEILGGTFPHLGLFTGGPTPPAPITEPATQLGDFVNVAPFRLLDTRSGAPLDTATSRTVQVNGVGGVAGADVTAVLVSITGAAAAGIAGGLAAWPAAGTTPTLPTLTVGATGESTITALVKVGANGSIVLGATTAGAPVHAVVDVLGYFRTATASRLRVVRPFRAADTRRSRKRLKAGATTSVKVRGLRGVPASADTVLVNLTTLSSMGAGHLRTYAAGSAAPGTTNHSFRPGETMSTLTWVQVGAGHKISITADGADTHVLVDVVGYLAGGGSGRFCPLPTARVADVRGARARSRTRVSIRGVGGVPASGVSAVVLKLSSSAPSRVASLTAYTVGASRPSLASLFSKPGRVTENLVVVAPGRYGAAYVYNSSGTTDLIVDVVGYFT